MITCLADQTSVVEGNSLTLRAETSDPDRFPWGGDDDKLTLSWQASQGRITQQNGSATFDSTGLNPGTYQVTAEVDDRKLTTTCTFDITVQKNALAPTVACEPGNVFVTSGQTTTLRANASDPNNDRLNYTWSIDGENVTNNQPSFNFGSAGRSLGAHSVAVRVTDPDGMSANCEYNVTIDQTPNQDPTVTLSLDRDEVYAGDRLGANAQANDPDGGAMTYAWSLDGRRLSDTSSRPQIDTSGLSGGRHTLEVVVTDERGSTASATRSFSVRERIVVQMSGMNPDNVAKAILDEVALKMRQNPQLRATLTGHTDDRGSEQMNESVGQRRADAVKAYLVDEQNVNQGRIDTGSAGETQPVAGNQTSQGREDNRRVEIELFVP
jgi:hypothetical protein